MRTCMYNKMLVCLQWSHNKHSIPSGDNKAEIKGCPAAGWWDDWCCDSCPHVHRSSSRTLKAQTVSVTCVIKAQQQKNDWTPENALLPVSARACPPSLRCGVLSRCVFRLMCDILWELKKRLLWFLIIPGIFFLIRILLLISRYLHEHIWLMLERKYKRGSSLKNEISPFFHLDVIVGSGDILKST